MGSLWRLGGPIFETWVLGDGFPYLDLGSRWEVELPGSLNNAKYLVVRPNMHA